MLGMGELIGASSGTDPVTIRAWGGGGASWFAWGHTYGDTNADGGGGGYVAATFAVPEGTSLVVRAGEGGKDGVVSYPGTQSSTAPGGGYSGVFLNGQPLLIAGGGGGGCWASNQYPDSRSGGAGGGLVGQDGWWTNKEWWASTGLGGTQTAGGGTRGGNGTAGGYLMGGSGGGGGGGGYYGGGGGATGAFMDNLRCGGGGSSYINPIRLSEIGFQGGNGRSPGGQNDPFYNAVPSVGWGAIRAGGNTPDWKSHGNDGMVVITYKGKTTYYLPTGGDQTYVVGLTGPSPTQNPSYASGLYGRQYSGWFNGSNPGMFTGNGPYWGTLSSLVSQSFSGDFNTYEFKGYLWSPAARRLRFNLYTADDYGEFYCGSGAINADSGRITRETRDFWVNLSAGYTPIRLRTSNYTGGFSHTFRNWFDNPPAYYNPVTTGY